MKSPLKKIRNPFAKAKSLKLSDYLTIVKPKYSYIKIIPHKSNRNYNTTAIAKTMNDTYLSLARRIHKEEKKYIIETDFKISYMIDMYRDNVNFYFIIPELFEGTMIDKIRTIWSKATIEKVEEIPGFKKDAIMYELSYKKDDALSLKVDKKSNDPLNQIITKVEMLKDDDRLTVFYNFRPTRIDWLPRYEATMKKVKSNELVDKQVFTFEYITKKLLYGTVEVLNAVLELFSELAGSTDTKENKEKSMFDYMLSRFNVREVSDNTNAKKNKNIISTQIAVISESKDVWRKDVNAISTCQAYRTIDEDNELMYQKRHIDKKKGFNIESTSIGTTVNYCSTDEVNNFIQIPGRELVEEFKMEHIKVDEVRIPEKLTKGIKCLGSSTYKGVTKYAYLPNEYNEGNLPLVILGSQGDGKTSFATNFCMDAVDAGEGIIFMDFIKDCEVSDEIAKVVPKDRLVVLDMADRRCMQGFGYNELTVLEDAKNIGMKLDDFKLAEIANQKAQQVMSFVDSISIGEPLTGRMRRFLSAAANVVMLEPTAAIKDIIECLEDFQIRHHRISSMTPEQQGLLKNEINDLYELDDVDKSGMIVGTKYSKIEHIIDRISLLREDFKLKYMYYKSIEDNINLVECMDQGKVVLIKMKEDDFPTEMVKNILVTYWVTKIWIANQIRGAINKYPKRVNVLADEIFQAPTSLIKLKTILPQSRKFGCKFIFTSQYLKQISVIDEALEGSGASYMLLKGCSETDFNKLKAKAGGYTYEDIKEMSKIYEYPSMNLIYQKTGHVSFITKLPYKQDYKKKILNQC